MVYGELRTKIGKGKETVGVVETLLVFAMAAFYFAVVAGRVWTDQLVPDPKPCSGQLKACGQVSFAIGETVGKFEAVVRLHTLYPHAAAWLAIFPLLWFCMVYPHLRLSIAIVVSCRQMTLGSTAQLLRQALSNHPSDGKP